MDLDDLDDVEFGGEASYWIAIQGELGAEWSARLGGLVITTRPRPDRAPLTTLVGKVRDQAELRGILETLYGLHFSLLRLERLAPGDPSG